MKSYKTKNMNLQLFAGENEITDLTGTSWFFNDSISLSNFSYTINFSSNNVEFSSLISFFEGGREPFGALQFGVNVVYDFDTGWVNVLWNTIYITGGTDATNSDLIAWLQANATQIQTGYDSTISLINCTCNKSNETGLSGSYTATITVNEGYYLSSVTSTLGTATIAENKKTAVIEISDVTANFTITAVGNEIENINIVLHPNNNGVTDYTKNMMPKVKTASTLDINRLFRTEYTITNTIINGIASGDTKIWSEETAQVTLTPDTNYNLPSAITVTNADNTYNSTSGVVTLSNATGNVTITAECEAEVSGYDITITKGIGYTLPCGAKIKINSVPTSSSDYDCLVDESGNITGNTSFTQVNKIYFWTYNDGSSSFCKIEVNGTGYTNNGSQYNNAMEVSINSNSTIKVYYGD